MYELGNGRADYENLLPMTSGYENEKKSLKLTIQNVNDPAHRVMKRVYTQFRTDTYSCMPTYNDIILLIE